LPKYRKQVLCGVSTLEDLPRYRKQVLCGVFTLED